MTRRLRRLALAAALGAAALAFVPTGAGAAMHHTDVVTSHAADSTDPLPTEVQGIADMPIAVPSTPSCTITLSHHTFGNSYGAPDTGPYAPPPGCGSPWSKVVLTLTSTVDGVQFDRSLTVSVGNVVLLHGTTSEPCCTGENAVTWTVQRDVTADSTVLEQASTYAVQLDNVNDTTYTGQYDTTVTLTYYQPGSGAPAADTAPFDVPVTTGNPAGEQYIIGTNGQTAGSAVSFPRNLDFLTADLFTDGQGPCEEFWWSAPNGTSCLTGGPYREVAIYLDGHLAGAAPVYPTVFTGGDGPGLWEPIPSPRTWNLRPYTVDLTPFVATLTDGRPHQVTLGVLDSAIGAGDFWPVAATLHGWVDPSTAQVSGEEVDTNPPTPNDDTSGSTAATYSDSASHTLTFTGILGAGPSTGWAVVYTVTESTSMSSTEDAIAGVTTDDSWAWSTESKVTPVVEAGAPPPPPPPPPPARLALGDDTVTTANSSIASSALTHFSFTDNARTTVTDGSGAQTWSEYDDSMDTSDASGLAANGVDDNTYRYGDSAGACYDRTLVAGGTGLFTSADGTDCPGATLPVNVAEVPAPAVLPPAAVAILLAAVVAQRRRRRHVLGR